MPQKPKRHPAPSLADREPAGYLANPSGGYVRVPRELMEPEHPLSPTRTGEPASKREALADLLAMAAWSEKADRAHGVALAGTRWLADRWRWPRTKVRRFLEELESNGTVSWMRGTTKGEPSRVLIVGYKRLQRGAKSGPDLCPPSRPTPLAHLPANNGAGSPEPVAHPSGPPSWPGGVPPTKAEVTTSHQEGDEGYRTRTRERGELSEEEEEALGAWWDAPPREKESEKKRGGHYCDSCGAPIGPTVDVCAKCAYGSKVAP